MYLNISYIAFTQKHLIECFHGVPAAIHLSMASWHRMEAYLAAGVGSGRPMGVLSMRQMMEDISACVWRLALERLMSF